VTLTGTATDNVGVAMVEVSIKNRATGLWLQADGSFAAPVVWHVADVTTPEDPAVTWSLGVTLPNGPYNPVARAYDVAGNTRTQDVWLPFDVGSADNVAPSPPLLDHAPFAEFVGPDVTLTGTATDNVGVAAVEVSIKNRATGLWLQADGSFAAPVVWHDTTLDNPGTPSVTWSIDVVLPTGPYNPVSRAYDAAGNTRTQNIWLPFDVT
jgi:hypothetical protein